MGVKIDISASGQAGYKVGQTRVIEFTCTDDITGEASDPDTLAVRVGVYTSERGVQGVASYVAGDLEHTVGTGLYQLVYKFEQQGKYIVEVSTTGTPTTVETEEIQVQPQPTWSA